MAHMGRPRKPSRMHDLAGNPGKRKRRGKEPDTIPADLRPPKDMRGNARASWNRLAPLLDQMQIFSETDRDALELYCTAYGHWKKAQVQINKSMMTKPTKKGGYIQQSPWVAIARQMGEQMRGIMVEFGMTPSARTRLMVAATLRKPKTPEEEEDEDMFGLRNPVRGGKRSNGKTPSNRMH